jgi:hypothetical protein
MLDWSPERFPRLNGRPRYSAGAVGTPFAGRGFRSMMTNERKIWEAALMLVRKHGAAAPEIAEREAHRLRSGGDELTCVVWCWIARTTAELLRPIPQDGERIH